MPGPLLGFVIFDSSRKHKVSGHYVVAGHAIWEALVIYLVLLGIGSVMKQYRFFIYLAGGFMLVLMGASIIKSRDEGVKVDRSKVNSSLLGGIFYTAFNPTQPLWWATAGLALLIQGNELMGTIGIAIVTIGHWLADLVYYTAVSYMIYRYHKYINPWQKQTSIILGVLIAILGTYFMFQAAIY